jgi:archaemetzincin
VLPDDELFHEPKPMLQSFRAWKHLKERNEVTPERRTIYVVPPPSTADCPDSARWISPIAAVHSQGAPMPNADDIIQYLRAFYTGLHVRKLDAQLRFAPWVDQPPHKRARRNKAPEPPARIAIECPGLGESIGVLHRQDPTNTFVRQLSLNDVLDVALELLPDDAYAVLMLVEHDLYEDEDDDFCIGRAFGGSRIAVVSCARYACDLVGRSPHDWPLSHCAAYVEDMCKAYTGEKGEKVKTKGCKANDNVDNGGPVPVDDLTPIGAAVLAASHAAAIDAQQQQLDNDTWLLRTCRTASHEVAHCLGLDHCEYYACIMQSTSSVSEDVRQPPYLCPVCSKKVLTATEAEEKEWTKAMEQVCTGRVGLGWKGLQAWCEWRLRELG